MGPCGVLSMTQQRHWMIVLPDNPHKTVTQTWKLEVAKHTLNMACTGSRKKSIKAVDKDTQYKAELVQGVPSKSNGMDTNNKTELVLDNKDT